ncbi:ATP-binding protein [Microbacterium sp. RD1]|uniref:ATP-binding protein n=1 Tax=Microbacterium sp. RD1 TaxID=3457313 RepID=UPI003FA57A3D
MRIGFFGGLTVSGEDGDIAVPGRGQQALLFRLALDPGTTIGYRALAEDLWGWDAPEDPRGALQSLVSRLRRALPAGALEAAPGGYRLNVTRDDVDVTRFADLVAAADSADPSAAGALASDALALWHGEPWTPSTGAFDWVTRDLLEDRARAERIVRSAPRAGAASSGALPAAVTPLVGRTPELRLIQEQLGASRLVTVLGPGGAGKTTLALETARALGDAIFAELAPASRGEVWTALEGVVGRSVRLSDASAGSRSPRERVHDALAGRSVLLVLDNCEHVSDEAAAVVTDLLRGAPGTRVLATSREPLGVPGEAFVEVGPLPSADGAELFAQRVRAASGSVPAEADAAVVDSIVRRLDGLPLALELAAAKTRTLTLREVDQGLDDRFALLSAGPRAAQARHQTLRALIDWSWDTLGTGERRALMTAAVFPDGFAADDVAVIAARVGVDPGAYDALVDRSLLTRRDGRFRMLETVREYGRERLRVSGEQAEVSHAAADALADLALAHDARLRGPGLREGLAWFDANDENLSAAIRFCVGADERETGVRLARARLWPWVLRDRFAELQQSVTAFTADDNVLDSEARVVLHAVRLMMSSLGVLTDPTGESDLSGFAQRTSTLLAAAADHPSDLTAALSVLLRAGRRAMAEHTPGRPWTPRDVRIDEDDLAGVPLWARAVGHTARAGGASNAGDIDLLGVESERALLAFREAGDPWGEGFASQLRSEWLMLEGRLEEALEVVDRSGAALEGLASTSDSLQQHARGAMLLVRLGRVEEAQARMRDIDAAARSEGSERARASARLTAAGIAIAVGDGAAALRELDRLGDIFPADVRNEVAAWAASERARALLLLGRPDDARDAIRAAVDPAVRSADHPIMSDVALALAGWLATTGRSAEAAHALAVSAGLRGRVDDADPFRRWVIERTDAAPEDLPPDAASAFTKLARLLE